MKKTLSFFILMFSVFMFSQEDIMPQVNTLKNEISKTDGIEKLKLMDSLSRLVRPHKQEYKYDSITKATIAFAYKLNDIDIALARTSSLIFYYANRVQKPKEGIKVLQDFEKKSVQTNDNNILARLYTNAGDAYFFSGAIEASIPIYEKAENFALKDKDTSLYATARTYKASAFVDMGDYATGSRLLKETSSIFTKQKDTTNLLMAQNSLAVIYSKIGFYEEAKEERNQVIQIAKKQKDYNVLIPNLYNAAIDARKQGNQRLRISYLREAAEEIKKQKKPINVTPVIYYGLVSAYAQNDSLAKAKIYFDKIQQEYATINPIPFEYEYKTALADYFIGIKDFASAKIAAEKVLAIYLNSNNPEGIYQAYKQLSVITKGLGDFESAFIYSSKHTQLKDSINSIQKARALSYYQTLYETEKRDFKIADQASEISLLDAENKINQQWMLFGGIGLLALFSIIYLIRSKRFAQKREEMQEEFSQELINEQEKERSRLARDLHDSVGQKLMLLSKQTKKTGNENMKHLASTTLEEVRSISRGLHPSNLERLGLTEAINVLIYDINVNTDLFFTEEIDQIDNILSKESELHLYRIIQETLSNIVKHSEAKAVKMNLKKTENTIKVEVSDNGKGFDLLSKQKSMSLGLKTLFERAKIIGAQMNLNSVINKGTILTVNVPI